MSDNLLVREVQVRGETTPGSREFTGIAVPWDTPTQMFDWDLGVYDEVIARGAVQDSDSALLFWRHSEPIGKLTATRDAETGWEITAKISATTRGDEAYTLLRDGVIDKLSIGFEPLEHTETTSSERGKPATITRTKIKVREISLVPFPAYETAKVSQVRAAQNQPAPEKDQTKVDTKAFDALATELRQSQDDHQREMSLLLKDREPTETVSQYRSAGEAIKALYAGKPEALEEYEHLAKRAYTGAKISDSVAKATWVGDLTTLVETASPLADIFSTGALPETGMSVDYGQLKSNTLAVGKQATEGADLVKGKIEIEAASAPVETFGGYTELSFQVIQRSSVAYLDVALRAMALEAGKQRAKSLREKLAAVRAAQVTATNQTSVTDATKFADWFSGIVDAAGIYEDLGLSMADVTMVTDPTIFKQLGGLTDTAGRPLFNITGTGVNSVGTINPSVIDANLAGLRVRLSSKQAAAGATMTHPAAIRVFNSAAVTLQDTNIVNLTQQASVYYYGAIADEMPGAIVPVKIGA